MFPMNFIRQSRIPCLVLTAVSIQFALPSAWAGGHPKRVLLGYAPVYPYYGTAAAPAAPAPAATGYYYAAAPAPAVRGHHFAAAPAPVATGYYYAAAPAAAPAPPAAAPAPVAAAPAPAAYYTSGGYFFYAGAPAAPAAIAGSPAPAAPSGARLTAPTDRDDVVEQLKSRNSALLKGKTTDDLRLSQLKEKARSLYASKLNTTSDDLTAAEKDDANALAASVYGGAPSTAGATATPAATSPATTAAAPAGYLAIPLVPIVARPVRQFWPHPRFYKY
jgi:hypothetical protein